MKPLIHCDQAADVIASPVERVAVVILAGGQGTRLGFSGPKGLYEVLEKPLFCHLTEKVPSTVPIAVMTSPLNHEQTLSFFTEKKIKASFFQQELVPLLNERLEPVDLGPDGNGGVYRQLVASGILDNFEQKGIDTIMICPVDNPLADPADPILLTYHRQKKAEVTVKCVERIPGESMGALAEKEIVEYFTIEEDPYCYSYTGQVAFSTSFIRKAAAIELPYHRILKKGLWKQERFIFDAFFLADRLEALCYSRNTCYAPIKGPESKESVELLLRGGL